MGCVSEQSRAGAVESDLAWWLGTSVSSVYWLLLEGCSVEGVDMSENQAGNERVSSLGGKLLELLRLELGASPGSQGPVKHKSSTCHHDIMMDQVGFVSGLGLWPQVTL